MQDSNITYTVTTQGIDQARAKFEQLGGTIKQMTVTQDGMIRATGTLNKVQASQAQVINRATNAQKSYFSHIAATTVQSALVNKLFLEFVDVSGRAIKQVDLMNNFPATMASLGQSTKDANEAFNTLQKYVGQIGGNMGNAVSMVTRFTGVTGDVKSAVAIFTGLNNALVAGDASMQEQTQAAIQFAQAFERGKPDMREWMSLTQNMSNQMALVAKEMGFVNASALGESLRAGKTSMAEFTTELTKLATGTGPIAQQAYARMNGMEFAFNVMKNTMVEGMAQIVNAFGRANIVSFFSFLTQVIRVLTGWVITLINWLGSLVNMISRLFGGGDVFKKVTGDVAANIAAGAKNTGDLEKGLGDAEKNAKKLNKQLASFDKMNVLADKESGGGKDDGGSGGGGFDPGAIEGLQGVFDGIGGKMEEISNWARVVAGILAGIAGMKILKGIMGELNDTIATMKTFKKNMDSMSESIKSAGKSIKETFNKNMLKGMDDGNKAKEAGTRIGQNVVTGIVAALSALGGHLATIWATTLVPALSPLGVVIASWFGATITAGAGAAVIAIGGIALAIAAIIGVIYLVWTNWDMIWGLIKDVFSAVWNFIVGQWQTFYDIFSGPVKWFLQFFEATFTLLIAIVAIALELVFKLFVGLISLIAKAFTAAVSWIYDNVVLPIGKFFADLWQGIINTITAAWNWIFENVLRPIGQWIYDNVILPVYNFFKSGWDLIVGIVSGVVDRIKNFLSPITTWIKTNIIDKIANFFTGLWNGVQAGLEAMMNGIKSIFSNITNIFKVPINGIIDLLNKALKGMNNIKVPDWVPGVGGKGVNFPTIPRLATGGVLDRATLAMVGENGEEAVIPLENNTEGLDKIASLLQERMGGGQPVQVVVQIGEEKIATKVIDLINEKTRMSGRNAILV